jgi:hypothetical protein
MPKVAFGDRIRGDNRQMFGNRYGAQSMKHDRMPMSVRPFRPLRRKGEFVDPSRSALPVHSGRDAVDGYRGPTGIARR